MYFVEQLMASHEARVAVAAQRDAFALMNLPFIKLLIESFALTRETVSLEYNSFPLKRQNKSYSCTILCNWTYPCSEVAVVQSGYVRYNVAREWLLLHVFWLQPSDVCAV